MFIAAYLIPSMFWFFVSLASKKQIPYLTTTVIVIGHFIVKVFK